MRQARPLHEEEGRARPDANAATTVNAIVEAGFRSRPGITSVRWKAPPVGSAASASATPCLSALRPAAGPRRPQRPRHPLR